MLTTNKNSIILKPSEIEGFILSEYGIGVDVSYYNGNTVIKAYNHLSLFSIINKIRRNFDFTIHHKLKKNEYLIIIGNHYE